MDGGSSTPSPTPESDSLLYSNGSTYRLLPSEFVRAGCYQPIKLGTRENYRAFFELLILSLAMRERLRLQRYYWAAYFVSWGGGDDVTWLVEKVCTGQLGLYQVVCSGPPRGEPQKLDEKKVRAAISTAADNMPVVAPIKSLAQAVTGADLVTNEPVNRLGAVAGIALGVVSSGKLIARGMKKISEKLGEKGLKQAQENLKHTSDERFNKRYHGPDAMTRDKDGKLTEWEAKGTQDGNTRVATNTQGRKQGSAKNNKAYAEKTLRQKKKVGKPSNRIGGPRTEQEMDVWQEVKDNDGEKIHMSVHTNTETGQVRVFERDHKGKIVKQTDEFQLDDFAAIKKKLIEEYGE